MAIVKAFKAHRPHPRVVRETACVPYDVISAAEARIIYSKNPNSFVSVIRPEVTLPEDVDEHDSAVYEAGRENLRKFLSSDSVLQEAEPCIYAYRQIWKGRSQTGIFCCVSVEDYDNNIILKHELTRPDKEDDRTRHILTQQAHAEPVMMTFKDTAGIKELLAYCMEKTEALYTFISDDGVEHTLWKMPNADSVSAAFESVAHLYIADGHHRCKSASRAADEMRKKAKKPDKNAEYEFFPAVLFPVQDLKILAYNRLLISVPDDFIAQLKNKFNARPTSSAIPASKGYICVYTKEGWFELQLPESAKNNPVSVMDVSRLQEFILEPLLGITDQRTDKNISFIGGIRGAIELEKLVNSGKAAAGISMAPTGIQELLDVSDAGLLMPPKSTWFEPKLKSGLLVHTF